MLICNEENKMKENGSQTRLPSYRVGKMENMTIDAYGKDNQLLRMCCTRRVRLEKSRDICIGDGIR